MAIAWARSAYQAVFVRDAHRLLLTAYDRLDEPHLRAADEEEDISGDLCAEMNAIVEQEEWASRYFVRNEHPLNHTERKGKRRPRIDVEIQYCAVPFRPGPRPTFRWEAKRLGPNNGTDKYLGDDGLGCFTDARYAPDHQDAGMVGYVQNSTDWQSRIERGLRKRRGRLQLVAGPALRVSVYEAARGFMTQHAGIDIHHVLLAFAPDAG